MSDVSAPLTLDAPGPGEVHVWLIPLSEHDSPADGGVSLLSTEERARCARYRREMDRRLCSTGHAATRLILSRYAPVEPSDWRFRTGEYGRPEIESPPAFRCLHFNRAHTSGLVALAFSLDRAVGVDVEHIERGPFDRRVAERCFTPAELEWVASVGEANRHRACLELWTLKEAYAKARGRGLSLPLRSVTFDLTTRERPLLSFDRSLDDPEGEWEGHLIGVPSAHVVAVAVEMAGAGATRLDVRTLEPGSLAGILA